MSENQQPVPVQNPQVNQALLDAVKAFAYAWNRSTPKERSALLSWAMAEIEKRTGPA